MVKKEKKKKSGKTPEKSFNKVLFFIISLGFLIRLFFVVETDSTPFFQMLFSDSRIYYDLAMIIMEGKIFGSQVFFMSPLYPYILAVIFTIAGKSIFTLRILQVLVSTANIYLIYLTGKKIFCEKTGLIAALIAALCIELIFYSGAVLSETFYTFFLSLFFYFVINEDNHSYKKWILSGLMLGICALFRANILLLIVPVLIYIFFNSVVITELSRKFRSAILFIFMTFMPVLPVTLQNYIASGDFVLLTSNGGINFYIGNNVNSLGVYQTPLEFDFFSDMSGLNYARSILQKKLTPSEGSAFWFEKAFDFIKKEPLRFLNLTGKKILIFIGGYDNPQSSVFDVKFFAEEFSDILKFPFINFLIISVLAFPGIILTFKKNSVLKLILSLILTFIFATIIFFVNGRFRLPLVPVLIIFSAFSIKNIYDLIREKKYLKLVLPLSLVSIFIIANFTVIPKIDFNNYDGYLNLGNYYFNQNNYEKAKEYYHKSLKQRDDYMINMNLGNIYSAEKEFDKAETYYRKSLKLNPGYAVSYFNLGNLFIQKNNVDSAEIYLKKALEINPSFADAHKNIAILYYIKEDFKNSLKHFEEFLIYSNNEADKETVRKDIEEIKIKLNSVNK